MKNYDIVYCTYEIINRLLFYIKDILSPQNIIKRYFLYYHRLFEAVQAQKKDEADRLNTWLNQTVLLKTDMRSVQANGRVEATPASLEELQALILKQQVHL